MNFSEAMQMLGTKLQGKYGHLGFKYKKSDKTPVCRKSHHKRWHICLKYDIIEAEKDRR